MSLARGASVSAQGRQQPRSALFLLSAAILASTVPGELAVLPERYNDVRTFRAPLAVLAISLAVASTLVAGVVLAFHGGAYSGVVRDAPAQVTVVRTPGNLVLPPLDRTITGVQLAERLAADVERLPQFPSDERCPIDFGTSYKLTFMPADGSSWAATIGAQGCQVVLVTNEPTLWAAHSPGLWADLATALGVSPSDVLPPVCLGAPAPSCAQIANRSH